MELLWIDLAQRGIIFPFALIIYAEDDPNNKQAYFFEGSD